MSKTTQQMLDEEVRGAIEMITDMWRAHQAAKEFPEAFEDPDEYARECNYDAQQIKYWKNEHGDSEYDIEDCAVDMCLSIETRSDWVQGHCKLRRYEYKLCIATGGPHIEIKGKIGHPSPTGVFGYWAGAFIRMHPIDEDLKAMRWYLGLFSIISEYDLS